MILTPLQKLPNNVGNLGKIIVATGFEWLPKVQKITQSGHIVTSHGLIPKEDNNFSVKVTLSLNTVKKIILLHQRIYYGHKRLFLPGIPMI